MFIYILIYQTGEETNILKMLKLKSLVKPAESVCSVTGGAGFTLIELLLVIALLAISIGVTGDIIVTLVRSYNKTQVSNEIEQNSGFVFLKLEKELRNSIGGVTVNTTGSGVQPAGASQNQLVFLDSTNTQVTYTVQNGYITRQYGAGASVYLTNIDSISGVYVECGATLKCFNIINAASPSVVKFDISFSQQRGSLSPIFSGKVVLDDTIVVRGTY